MVMSRSVVLNRSCVITAMLTLCQKHEHTQGVNEEETYALNHEFVEDPPRTKRLRRMVDLKFLPLCAFVYLLNYLDRGNIGAARIMNEETKDDILDVTGTSTQGYAVAVSLFSLAYATFEIPSNYVMKRFVRPSLWLAILLFGWAALTLGFTGASNERMQVFFMSNTWVNGRALRVIGPELRASRGLEILDW